MASRRRVQSAQAAPGRPPQHYYPPIYQPDAPDYDYNPQPPPPPPGPPPRSGPPPSSYFTPNPSSLAFPEPQLYRSISVGSAPQPRPTLTVSDYGHADLLSPTYGIPEPALDPASFGYGPSTSTSSSSGGFPNPYGSVRQFSESSYSFGGADAYSFTTSESPPERSPSVTFSHLR
jgi:hypothetical protein